MLSNNLLTHKKVVWANRYNLLKGTCSLIYCDLIVFTLPYLIKLAIDSLQGNALPQWIPAYWRNLPPLGFLFSLCFLYLGASAAMAYGRYWWRVFFIWSTFPLFHKIRMDFFKHLMSLDREFFKSHKVGDLLSALTNDTENVRNTLAIGGLMAVDASIYFILFPILLWQLDSQLTLMVVIPLFLSSFIAIFLSEKLSARYERVQNITGDLSARAFEMCSGVRVIKAFRKEKDAHATFGNESRKLRNESLEVARYQSLFVPGMDFILGMALCFALFYGGFQVIQNKMPLSNFVAFQLYLVHMDWPMMAFGWFIQLYRQSQASQKRVQVLQLISNPLEPKSIDQFKSTSDVNSIFEIQNISYKYPEQLQNLFHQLDLSFSENKWIGLTGPVGSGKTTLLELLSRQRDPTAGDIFFKGENLKSKSPQDWAEKILYIPQETFLFSRSIRKNITLGMKKPPQDDSLWELLSDLSFDAEILKERGGLEVRLGERGANLSGGQRQRVSIGRAIIRQREVYLFDDLFSHVDAETESKLIRALKKRISPDAFVVMVSQRIETLLQCEQLIVLNETGAEFYPSSQEAIEQSLFMKRLLELQNLGRKSA
ncbi:MAG: ABC transporter ATP-binding protein [Deltaproteobacteria bacterium]|nr:ABC transporter ATP-binding protein [Deltaproteobacteria bacterium]